MSISDVVVKRNISQIVHFTTNKGLIGILDSGFLKSRALLSNDDRLEFILKNNSTYRKDIEWINYVNLSITKVNQEFFDYCSKWHNDIFWCVLYFSPDIISHDNVVFTTTNNIYPSVKRGFGEDGLEKLFDNMVLGKYGKEIVREVNKPLNLTTDIQGEVLYPEKIDIRFLQRIVVASEEHADDISGITYPLSKGGIVVDVDKNIFK